MKLAKIYDPNQYEPNIYAMWEESGAFNPKGEGEPFCIVMPPPNANGNLHMGHALTVDLQDILTRYYRMKGYDVAYIPGADHAGFETWVVYEKVLEGQGRSRFDFSREQLYSQVWNFVEQQRGNMELQLRALGVSASWKDLVFTLDKKVITTVYKTFKRLWDEDLIYRGERIVNYSTKYQTSYADIEVNHKLEKGTLWHIAYPTYDKIGEIIVATTRPETIFGDTAVAVHPDDERYKHLIGTRVLLPLTDREIPIIADKFVDPTFGTDDYDYLWKTSKKIAKHIQDIIGSPRVGVVVEGFGVPHTHIHLIPIYHGNDLKKSQDESNPPNHDALAKTAARLKM